MRGIVLTRLSCCGKEDEHADLHLRRGIIRLGRTLTPDRGKGICGKRRHDAIERLWWETKDGSFLGTVVAASSFWDLVAAEHDWWHNGRLAGWKS